MTRYRTLQPVTGVLLTSVAASLAVSAARHVAPAAAAPQTAIRNLSRRALSFEPNLGQTSKAVKFMSRGSGYSLFLAPDGATLGLHRTVAVGTRPGDGWPSHPEREKHVRRTLKLNWLGASKGAGMTATAPQDGVVNYLRGRNSSSHLTGVPLYGRVRARGIYPGIDAVYYGNQNQLEYDLEVAPGADPSQARLGVEGARKVRLDQDGNASLETDAGSVLLKKPVVYQWVQGRRRSVPGSYELNGGAKPSLGFRLGNYDRSLPLVIDPILLWSTFLGGSGLDAGRGIAVDRFFNVYVAGWTDSPNFPATAGAASSDIAGDLDAYVTKLTPNGESLVYSTFVGGSGPDRAFGLDIDPAGNAYIAGGTGSVDFPIAAPIGATPPQSTYGGGPSDIFITKLSANGSEIVYSTYLGGDPKPTIPADVAYAIAVDLSGNAYITGETGSPQFPLLRPYQSRYGGGPTDAVVAKLTVLGELDFSTFLGAGPDNYTGETDFGTGVDAGYGIDVDLQGNIYVTGCTSSRNFPVFNNLQRVNRSKRSSDPDAFVAKLVAGGQKAQYITYLGGVNADCGYAIAADASGNCYITGITRSNNFPTSKFSQPLRGTPFGADDAFVSKIDAGGVFLVYSTFLGGSDNDQGRAIAVDAAGNTYITGATSSVDFPVTRPLQPKFGGLFDAFITKLDDKGSAVIYSAYFGSNNQDYGHAIALDSKNGVYVAGTTLADTFPTTLGVVQPNFGGGASDAFVSKIVDDEPTIAGGRISVPATLRFPKCKIGFTTTRRFRIRNTGRVTLVGNVGRTTPPFFVAGDGGPFSLGRRKFLDVDIRFRPDAPGRLERTLTISSSDERFPLVTVKLIGTGVLP